MPSPLMPHLAKLATSDRLLRFRRVLNERGHSLNTKAPTNYHSKFAYITLTLYIVNYVYL